MTPDFALGAITLDALPATPLASANNGSVNQVYSVDLDADGASDLLIFGGTSSTGLIQPGFVAFGDGHGGYVPAAVTKFPELASVHVRELALADFNDDGDLDVFVGDHGWDVPPFAGAQNHLYLSNGDGTWRDATGTLPQQSDFTHSVATGDLDGDGDIDILANNSALPSYVHVLLNDGDGQFTPRTDFLPTGPDELLDPTQRNSLAAAMADLDHDGWDDIVLGTGVPNPNEVPAQVLWNEEGSFGPAAVTDLPLPARFGEHPEALLTYELIPMDVDFDGRTDLVLSWIQSVELGGYELQVLVNDGNRGFTDRTSEFIPDLAAQSSPDLHWIQFLVPADMNGDGRMDLVVDARGGQKPVDFPVALIHQADGTFAVFRQSDTPWVLGGPHWAWWPGGTGFFAIDRPQDGFVGGDMFGITFDSAGPHWVGGTVGDDELQGTAGADEIAGFAGDDSINGGAGVDFARYSGNRDDAGLTPGNATWFVTAPGSGADALVEVERLQFDDTWVALDIDGPAGQVARILGALFGPAAVANPGYVGIGLDFLDSGMSYSDLVTLAVSLFGPRSHAAFVNSVYSNVVGVAPAPAELAHFVGLLDAGAFTQSSLAFLACETELVAVRIDLAGLAASGLEYVPN
ncbi:MAG: VCBS repeat-containing protein [Burkholderiales bacterium]|nr:VCBS repeat-containing protein [Burkholderiales bacterium]